MGIVERKERRKESLRQEILDAARDILLAEGYAKLSMRGIAERIEYSPTTIYSYFRNKEEILHHLCEEGLERQLAAIQRAGRDEPAPVPRLRAELRAYIDFGLSEPGRYQIVYMADLSQYVSMASILEEGSPAFRLRDLIRRGISDVLSDMGGELDMETVSQAVWAHCHGIVSLLIGRPDFPWVERERLIETGLDILFRGLDCRMVR